MAVDVDFQGIGEALVAMFEQSLTDGGVYYKAVKFEPDIKEFTLANTPFVALMLADGTSQPRAGKAYYDQFTITVEVGVADLSNWATAKANALVIFRNLRGAVRENPRFHVDVNEAKLAGYEFENALDTEDDRWFCAVARFDVVIGVYYDT